MTELQCSEGLNRLAEAINYWANEKGFWDFQKTEGVLPDSKLVKNTKLLLVVSELVECMEGLRKPGSHPSQLSGFTNEEEEIADAIIRLLDYAGQYDLRIGEAVLAKMAYNEGRPYKHGKAF
jgi:hypothetical protein